MLLDSELIFMPASSQSILCQQIPLVNDDSAEDTEFFLISLSSSTEGVLIDPPTQVTIIDQDSQ